MKLEDYFEILGTYELKDGVYDVKGSIRLIEDVYKLPLKFGTVSGDFSCTHNKLKSLEGCPTWVGGNFFCIDNNLTSLEGAPECVRNFSCHYNKLTSLKGSPNWVGGNFRCGNNKLTSLKGSPSYIGGDFDCDEILHNTKEYRQYLIMKKLRE